MGDTSQNDPLLGLATTRQVLEEPRLRMMVVGYSNNHSRQHVHKSKELEAQCIRPLWMITDEVLDGRSADM